MRSCTNSRTSSRCSPRAKWPPEWFGHSAIAVQLAEGFGARFPKSEDIVRNGLVAARLMRERLGREADARALLQALDRAHPDHPLAGEVRAALYASR